MVVVNVSYKKLLVIDLIVAEETLEELTNIVYSGEVVRHGDWRQSDVQFTEGAGVRGIPFALENVKI